MVKPFFKPNMKNNKKQMVFAAALTIILSISTLPIFMPTVNAHDPPWNIPTWTYVVAYNNVIGVNQQEKFIYWLGVSPPPTASGAFGDRWNFTLEITRPDAEKEILGPFKSDPVGGGYAFYTPTLVGTYTVVAKFPGHIITGEPYPPNWGPTSFGYANVNDTYEPSVSDPITFTVTNEPLQLWQEAPLPTGFWTRPINSANVHWWPLTGNWLGGAAQNVGPTTNFGYGTAPESSHVMWKTPACFGGLMDARFGDLGYTTSHYEGINFNPIILNGRIYYNAPNSEMREGYYVLDLYTGDQLLFYNTTGPVTGAGGGFDSHGGITQQSIAFAQIIDIELPNQMGGYPYLWSTTAETPNTWLMYDAYTNNYICSINNVPSWATSGGGPFGPRGGTAVYGKDGSILSYNIVNTGTPDAPQYYLQCWNTTQAIWWKGTQQQYQNGDYSGFSGNNYFSWRPYLNYTFDGSHGYSINVSIPNVPGNILTVRENQLVIGGTAGSNNENGITLGQLWALNLDPAKGAIGSLLWNRTFTPPSSAGNKTISMGDVDPEDGVFLFSCVQTKQRWGYSLETGQPLWGPTEPEDPMKYYGMPNNIYQGMLISYTYLCGGTVYSYNITTGELLWTYTPTQIGYESPFGDYPAQLACVADGKIFIYSSPLWRTNPLWRGSYLRCINASDGAELWKVLHYGSAVVADGFVVGLNYYDNNVYCYGKGPSATTAMVQNDVITQGSQVLIKGTVTDQSPGAIGTPAIADENMDSWMEYLYQQQAKPEDANGVKVHLTAIDPNGNFQDLGTATSDITGNFAIMWQPPVPGLYTVTAEFAGSKSYWPSSAETHFGVETADSLSAQPATTQSTPVQTAPSGTTPPPATSASAPVSPSPSQAPQPTSGTPTTTYIAIGAAAIIIAVAVSAVFLKRRK
ncbi:MAG: hypothetical protein NWF00_06215 [Candidatus Bathyarchaeota archaeon]|nr:hypothetical protein [Candidatus Bathyarchaeota archaeon]